jgi:hypothetical protein
MRTQHGLPTGLALIALSGLAFASWTTIRPAAAQEEPGNPGQPPPPGRHIVFGGPASIAAGGNYVYVLRGNTLFQMRASDLSFVKQMELPAPGPGEGEPPNPNPPHR